jgi:hypothetical protein
VLNCLSSTAVSTDGGVKIELYIGLTSAIDVVVSYIRLPLYTAETLGSAHWLGGSVGLSWSGHRVEEQSHLLLPGIELRPSLPYTD